MISILEIKITSNTICGNMSTSRTKEASSMNTLRIRSRLQLSISTLGWGFQFHTVDWRGNSSYQRNSNRPPDFQRQVINPVLKSSWLSWRCLRETQWIQMLSKTSSGLGLNLKKAITSLMSEIYPCSDRKKDIPEMVNSSSILLWTEMPLNQVWCWFCTCCCSW